MSSFLDKLKKGMKVKQVNFEEETEEPSLEDLEQEKDLEELEPEKETSGETPEETSDLEDLSKENTEEELPEEPESEIEETEIPELETPETEEILPENEDSNIEHTSVSFANAKKIKEEKPKRKEKKSKKAKEKSKKIEITEEKTKSDKVSPKKEIKEKAWFESEGQLVVDLYETNGEIVIQSAIAGVKPEDLNISIENDMVSIRGERQETIEQKEKNYLYQECHWGSFSREIVLPAEVDSGHSEADMKDGVLTIRMPKIEREGKKQLVVK
tara:strand:- start:34 stop:846 length:813 start_codon:yes stop_codon:yes gene_type:complete